MYKGVFFFTWGHTAVLSAFPPPQTVEATSLATTVLPTTGAHHLPLSAAANWDPPSLVHMPFFWISSLFFPGPMDTVSHVVFNLEDGFVPELCSQPAVRHLN